MLRELVTGTFGETWPMAGTSTAEAIKTDAIAATASFRTSRDLRRQPCLRRYLFRNNPIPAHHRKKATSFYRASGDVRIGSLSSSCSILVSSSSSNRIAGLMIAEGGVVPANPMPM